MEPRGAVNRGLYTSDGRRTQRMVAARCPTPSRICRYAEDRSAAATERLVRLPPPESLSDEDYGRRPQDHHSRGNTSRLRTGSWDPGRRDLGRLRASPEGRHSCRTQDRRRSATKGSTEASTDHPAARPEKRVSLGVSAAGIPKLPTSQSSRSTRFSTSTAVSSHVPTYGSKAHVAFMSTTEQSIGKPRCTRRT